MFDILLFPRRQTVQFMSRRKALEKNSQKKKKRRGKKEKKSRERCIYRPMQHHKNVLSQLHLECEVAVDASLHLNTLGVRISTFAEKEAVPRRNTGTVSRSLYTSCVPGAKESGSRPEEECSSSELISQQGLYAGREEIKPS